MLNNIQRKELSNLFFKSILFKNRDNLQISNGGSFLMSALISYYNEAKKDEKLLNSFKENISYMKYLININLLKEGLVKG